MRIAIHQNHAIFSHSTSWDREWISYCESNGLEYSVVDCFAHDILSTLRGYDVLLWHFGGYSLQEMLFARSILQSARELGLRVFPDHATSWHFDDKVSADYLLRSVSATMPDSWMFYTIESAAKFFSSECHYPVVAKLKCGSGSQNVRLLRNASEAISYARRMFGRGFRPVPSLIYKAKSNAMSAGDWATVVKRLKRIPDFLESLRKSRSLPSERGYVYVQEFIPNDGFDLKVAVVGDKLSFLARDVRSGDFRASGGGAIRYDMHLLTKEIIDTSFDLSRILRFQCMGYDYVVDNRNAKPQIVEISYGFSHTAQLALGGHFDRDGNWYDEPFNAPVEVIKLMLRSICIDP